MAIILQPIQQHVLSQAFLLLPFVEVMTVRYTTLTGRRVMHMHEGLQIIAGLEGRSRLGTASGEEMLVEKGSVLFIPVKLPHNWSIEVPARTVQILLSPVSATHYGELAELFELPPGRMTRIQVDPEELHSCAELIDRCHGGFIPGNSLELTGRLLLLLANLLAELHRSGRIGAIRDPVVNRALEYIEMHIREKISLRDIAQYSGLGVSRFSEVFRKNLGCPPMEFITRSKLKQAATMLKVTNLSVKELTEYFGFQSTSYFCHKFKELYHTTPKGR